MQRALTPTLALIVAGGLAAGIALARPADTTTNPAPAATAAPAADTAAPADTGYRQGTREAGARGGESSTPAAPAAPAAPATVTIEGFAFGGPDTVAPGAAITVTNLDGAPHTLTFRNGEVDTGTLEANTSTTVTAPLAPGTYEFFCQIHPSMQGRITVAA